MVMKAAASGVPVPEFAVSLDDLKVLCRGLAEPQRQYLWQWLLKRQLGEIGRASMPAEGRQQLAALHETASWFLQQGSTFQTALADQLAQLAGSWHQRLVIQQENDGDQPGWFWLAWEVVQWRQQLELAGPEWLPGVLEQLVRYGALAWAKLAETPDLSVPERQEAINRTITLLKALGPLHQPLPFWIPQLEKQLLQLGIELSLKEASPFVAHLEPALLPRQRPAGLPERLLLVLGMHRSGTSALSGALCQLGLCGPSDPEPARQSNPTGHWEPQAIIACHEALLAEAQSSWDHPQVLAELWRSRALSGHRQAMEAALKASFPQLKAGQVVLVKDPRQCRLQPLWNGLLEEHSLEASVVLMLRHPLAVAQSLQRRNQLPIDRSLLLWLSHTLEAERHTRHLRRSVVVYEQLLRAPDRTLLQCLRLAGLEVQRLDPSVLAQWIRSDLNHGSSKPDSEVADGALLELVLAVYERLAAAHGSAPDAQLRQWLDQAHAQLEQRLQALRHQSSRLEMVQLFWEPNDGGGFREEHSVRSYMVVDRGVTAVTFMLPAAAKAPLALRLDPAEQPVLIQLQRLVLLDRGSQVLWEWQHDTLLPANLQTAILDNGVVLSADHNSGLLLVIPAEVLAQLGEGCSLELEARWEALRADVAHQLLRSVTGQKPVRTNP